MPTWGQLLQELNGLLATAAQRVPVDPSTGAVAPSAFDLLRRKYLAQLANHTGRGAIVYATAWLEPSAGPGAPATAYSVNLGDVQGFMEACSNITERELDLHLTSPGGSPEAAESIMAYLRTRFDHIRVIVPVAAMSAATMMALAADEIVMGAHSQLGPIDPQFTVVTPEGPRSSPAQAILDQFELAKLECQNPSNLPAWLPILRTLAPGLIAQCIHQRGLAEQFATTSLKAYMFRGEADAEQKAKDAAAWFADFTAFRSHGRRVSRDDARSQGLRVTNLESDQLLQDAVLSVHHAVRLTFGGPGVGKLIENHHGRAYIETITQTAIQLRPTPPAGPTPALIPGGQVAPSRQQRRQADRQQRKTH